MPEPQPLLRSVTSRAGFAVAGPLLALMAGCTTTSAHFSDVDDLDRVVASEISYAEESVHVAIYAYSPDADDSPRVHEELQSVGSRGKDVKFCADASSYYGGTVTSIDHVNELDDDENVQVRLADGHDGGIMHHKFVVIDSRVVVTGSYNYTRSATQVNDENVVVLYDPSIAEAYEAAFSRLWDRAEPIGSDEEDERR